MTINDVLTRVKRDRPGESTDAEMIQWLSQLDGKWYDEIIMTHRLPATEAGTYPWRYPVKLTREAETVYGTTVTCEEDCVTINGTSTTPSGWDVPLAAKQYVHVEKGQEVRISLQLVSGSVSGEGAYRTQMSLTCADDDNETLWFRTIPVGEAAIITVEETGNCTLDIIIGANEAVYTKYTLRAVMATRWPSVDGFRTYAANVEQDTELLIPEPDDEIYIHWLYAKIDYRLGELERYNVDAQLYNQAWSEAAKRYNRHHMPLGRTVHHVAYGRPVPWWGDEDPLNQRTRGAW